MLYSTQATENSLTAYSAACGENSLGVASIWLPVSFALAILVICQPLNSRRQKILSRWI
jgi:hypothetical protein